MFLNERSINAPGRTLKNVLRTFAANWDNTDKNTLITKTWTEM